MQLDFNPFPILQTSRLTLRQLELAQDLVGMFQLLRHPEQQRYLKRTVAQNQEVARAHILRMNRGIAQNQWFYWGITKEQELIGTIALWNFSSRQNSAEIGYELHPDFQGQGLMSEAMQAVINYGVESIGLAQFRAVTAAQNSASIRLLERQHFVLKKILSDEPNMEQHLYVRFV